MNLTETIQNKYNELNAVAGNGLLGAMRAKAFELYNKSGIPSSHNEEWKYTRLTGLTNKNFSVHTTAVVPGKETLNKVRLQTEYAAELFFVNGVFVKEISTYTNDALVVLNLHEAAESEYKNYVQQHLNQSSKYMKDGMNALNAAFTANGLFVVAKKNKAVEKPVFIYHLTDTASDNVFVQPRSLFVIEENAQVQLIELYKNNGLHESFTNEVIEIAVQENARLEYYKVQDENENCHHVGTTHVQQVGKCFTHCVTVTLNGGTIRNNINMILEAENNEGHLYGLYMVDGKTHVDNHSIVDNVKPNCFSNEFYKGIMDGNATGVFNGKIFVRQDAQKTNAYQSNKNVLMGDNASVNTKPQLEIFADDVKCSHGCTVGRLDDEALFYLRARGIGEKKAKALLLHAFAADILEQVKIEVLRTYLEQKIDERLEIEAI
ncbi:Fe-S cluster assembly protein SufD [Parafilimonas sp.]|uniref:Fe-S cluster assembly protein SufD n=1 Tax=Parafilimonas sp. TaxID=1969739 RepID=UPI0039E289F2